MDRFDIRVTRARLLAIMAALAAAGVTPLRAAALEKVNVAVGAEHALVYLPWDLAKALGYFEQEGLDANLFYTKGGSEAAQALVSGSADFSGNAIDHAIAAQAQGKALVMVDDFMGVPGIVLLIRPGDKDKYKTMADLKGKTIGVTTIGAASHILALWLAHKAGLGKEDIKVVGVGGGPTMPAALGGGRVDAALGNDPFATQLVNDGRAVALIDLYDPAAARKTTGFSAYCWTGALTRGDMIANKPQTVQKVVNALVRAQKWMLKHAPMDVAKALPDDMRLLDAAKWVLGYTHSRTAFTDHGEVSPESVHAVIETNAYFAETKSGAKIDEAKLFDNSFVEKANKTVKV